MQRQAASSGSACYLPWSWEMSNTKRSPAVNDIDGNISVIHRFVFGKAEFVNMNNTIKIIVRMTKKGW